MNFISREVVFLFPSDHIELENFLKNIIATSSKSTSFHNLPTNILASIIIEIPGKLCNNLKSFVFKYEGDKVQLYSDLLNTMTKIADFHGLNANFENSFYFQSSLFSFSSVGQAIIRQFLGHLNSVHNYLLQYFCKFFFNLLFQVLK